MLVIRLNESKRGGTVSRAWPSAPATWGRACRPRPRPPRPRFRHDDLRVRRQEEAQVNWSVRTISTATLPRSRPSMRIQGKRSMRLDRIEEVKTTRGWTGPGR